MGWIEDVGVDQLNVGANLIVPFGMPLLDVLTPKVYAFKEFSAVWDLASEFVDVFLFDELDSTVISRVSHVVKV